MRRKNDSGVSVVIAFVMIIAILSIAIGMWALFGIPAQVREANEAQTIAVVDSLTDYKVMLENLRDDPDFMYLGVSTLIPLGSSYSSGVMTLKSEKVGTLTVSKTIAETDKDGNELPDVQYPDFWTQDVTRLSMTVGNHGTEVGYEGGGIYRNDNGNYVWEVYPTFSIIRNGVYYLTLGDISNITGDINIGGSGDIAINTKYNSINCINADDDLFRVQCSISGKKVDEDNPDNKAHIEEYFTIKYKSETKEDANLWYSMFYETNATYNKISDENLTTELSGVTSDNSFTFKITSSDSSATAKAYLYGFTYSAELVPDVVVREPEVTWSNILGMLDNLEPGVQGKKWENYFTDTLGSANKGNISYDRPSGDYYVFLNSVSGISKGTYPYAASYYSDSVNKNTNIAKIDRTVGHIYSSSDDVNEDIWKSAVAGSLYKDEDAKLYLCISNDQLVGEDDTEKWKLIGTVNS